ncbi:MAG TPA: glutathione binding-like protein [Myxococcaceae bacterium]|nr:glutathione binding-like protein [Myxococcaceae bacterium]
MLVIRSLSPVEAHRGPQGYVLSDQLRLRHRQMFLEAEGKTELPEGCSELLEQKARERFCQAIAVLEEHLAGRKFLVGDRFSAADVVMGAVLGWGRQLVRFLPDFPNCHEYTRAMLGRPAAKKALED